jgi:hypothetical protein
MSDTQKLAEQSAFAGMMAGQLNVEKESSHFARVETVALEVS